MCVWCVLGRMKRMRINAAKLTVFLSVQSRSSFSLLCLLLDYIISICYIRCLSYWSARQTRRCRRFLIRLLCTDGQVIVYFFLFGIPTFNNRWPEDRPSLSERSKRKKRERKPQWINQKNNFSQDRRGGGRMVGARYYKLMNFCSFLLFFFISFFSLSALALLSCFSKVQMIRSLKTIGENRQVV